MDKLSTSAIREAILSMNMKNNSLRNYIVPGLTSYLIGGKDHGLIRLFESERETREFITPHSHRFNFTALVLAGTVENTLFHMGNGNHEQYCRSTINQVCGKNGLNEYKHVREDIPSGYYSIVNQYKEGDTYTMEHDQIHSVKFSRGAQVLFFEGPQLVTTSDMIEPWENGKVVPTFKTESWMFEREWKPQINYFNEVQDIVRSGKSCDHEQGLEYAKDIYNNSNLARCYFDIINVLNGCNRSLKEGNYVLLQDLLQEFSSKISKD